MMGRGGSLGGGNTLAAPAAHHLSAYARRGHRILYEKHMKQKSMKIVVQKE
jgi:hypothetical protein